MVSAYEFKSSNSNNISFMKYFSWVSFAMIFILIISGYQQRFWLIIPISFIPSIKWSTNITIQWKQLIINSKFLFWNFEKVFSFNDIDDIYVNIKSAGKGKTNYTLMITSKDKSPTFAVSTQNNKTYDTMKEFVSDMENKLWDWVQKNDIEVIEDTSYEEMEKFSYNTQTSYNNTYNETKNDSIKMKPEQFGQPTYSNSEMDQSSNLGKVILILAIVWGIGYFVYTKYTVEIDIFVKSLGI